jgi:hypothetical protein
MASEIVVDMIKLAGGILFGGMATAAFTMPYIKSELTELKVEVNAMKVSCTTCKTGVDKTLDTLKGSIDSHHADADKHNNSASEKLLQDIYDRVVRIEGKIFNGTGHN